MSSDFSLSSDLDIASVDTSPLVNTNTLQKATLIPGSLITGTVGSLVDQGDDFTLVTPNNGSVIVDPENVQASQLNLVAGETLTVQVREWDRQEIDTDRITRADGSVVLDNQLSLRVLGTSETTTAATRTVDPITGDVLNTPIFDSQTYLANNPDVAAAGVDPWQHFIHHGAREGRLPQFFNQNFYLSQYPDLQAAYAQGNFDPWKHFLEHGAQEGRVATPNATAQQSQQFGRFIKSNNDEWLELEDLDLSDSRDRNDDYSDDRTNTLTGTVTQQYRADRFMFNSNELGSIYVETDNDTPIVVTPGESLTLIGKLDNDDPEFEVYQATRNDGSSVLTLPVRTR